VDVSEEVFGGGGVVAFSYMYCGVAYCTCTVEALNFRLWGYVIDLLLIKKIYD